MSWAPKQKRRWLILTCGVILYASLWWLTHRFGAAQVRSRVVASFPAPFTDVTYTGSRGVSRPFYYCRAVAWAPFLVRVHYSWDKAPLNGAGGRVLYLWFLGPSFRLWEYEHVEA